MPRFLIRGKLVNVDSPQDAIQEFLRLVPNAITPTEREVSVLPDVPARRVRYVCRSEDVPREWREYVSWLTATHDPFAPDIVVVDCDGLPDLYFSGLEVAEARWAVSLCDADYHELVSTPRRVKPGILVFRNHEYVSWRRRARAFSVGLSSSRQTHYFAEITIAALTNEEAGLVAMHKATHGGVDALYDATSFEEIHGDNTSVDDCTDLGLYYDDGEQAESSNGSRLKTD
jgi:hypothetical protein